MLRFEDKPASRMTLSQPLKNQSIDRTEPTDWFSFVIDDRVKLVIPVGPRFQVDVPSWTPPPASKSCLTTVDTESDNSKWLGTRVWPLEGRPQDKDHDMVGRGRPQSRECAVPGSIGYVRRHVYITRRISVQSRLKYEHINSDYGGGGDDSLCLKGARKRLHADFNSSSRKYMKTAHLGS